MNLQPIKPAVDPRDPETWTLDEVAKAIDAFSVQALHQIEGPGSWPTLLRWRAAEEAERLLAEREILEIWTEKGRARFNEIKGAVGILRRMAAKDFGLVEPLLKLHAEKLKRMESENAAD